MSHLSIISPKLDAIKSHQGVLCLPIFEDPKPLRGITGLMDWRLLGQLSKLNIEKFITGTVKESVLFPLGNRLSLEHLILVGMGVQAHLNQELFTTAIAQMFSICEKLSCRNVHLALPGRPEKIIDAPQAFTWFLDIYPTFKDNFLVTIIDTYETHPIFQAEVEKRRMKASVTPP